MCCHYVILLEMASLFLNLFWCWPVAGCGSINTPNPLDVGLYATGFGFWHGNHILGVQKYRNVFYFPKDGKKEIF